MRVLMILLPAVLLGAVLVGCEATGASDLAEPTWQTTASYDQIFSQPYQLSPITPRDWPASIATYEQCVVTHFPSYYRDPLVIDGDGNDSYGWTLFDLFAIAYSPAVAGINTIALPVSMVVEPPFILVTSDLDAPIDELPAAQLAAQRVRLAEKYTATQPAEYE